MGVVLWNINRKHPSKEGGGGGFLKHEDIYMSIFILSQYLSHLLCLRI